MLSLKAGIEDLKQAKTLMSEANGIMSDHISKLKALEEENARLKADYETALEHEDRLKAELDDWKGNAEGFQPDAYMKLPLDADGIAIKPGDKIYFSEDPTSEAFRCIAIGTSPLPVEFVDWEEIGTEAWEEGFVFTHRPPNQEPADSWEKLEEDLLRGSTADAYFQCGDMSCSECPYSREVTGRYCWMNRNLDILARAKKLAGVEEEVER